MKSTLKDVLNRGIITKLLNDIYQIIQIRIVLQDIDKKTIFYPDLYVTHDEVLKSDLLDRTPIYLKENQIGDISAMQFMKVNIDLFEIYHSIISIINEILRASEIHLSLHDFGMKYSSDCTNMAQGVFLLHKKQNNSQTEYRIKEVNTFVLNEIALNRSDLVGKNFGEWINHEFGIDISKLQNCLESVSGECREIYANKKGKYFQYQLFHISDNEVVVLVSDITWKKQEYGKLSKFNSLRIIESLLCMVEKRDLYTKLHQRRVAYVAKKIAIELKMKKNQVETVYVAGLVHDIGKIGVPSEILTKPDRLTELEFEVIKQHVINSYDILKNINFAWPIHQIILQHHEKMDGSGYPMGLVGEQIVMESKILCVADTVEAIASHRPYRPSLGLDFALSEIRRYSGIWYDDEVIRACCNICETGSWEELLKKATSESIYQLIDE